MELQALIQGVRGQTRSVVPLKPPGKALNVWLTGQKKKKIEGKPPHVHVYTLYLRFQNNGPTCRYSKRDSTLAPVCTR